MTSTPHPAQVQLLLAPGGQHETARWAIDRLTAELTAAGLEVGSDTTLAPAARIHVDVTGPADGPGRESFSVRRPDGDTIEIGGGPTGVGYALTDLADTVATAEHPVAALLATAARDESPATPVRSVLRTFASDSEDRPWFVDPDFWTGYLDELATHRINRLHLALGMSYNYSHDLDTQDNYLQFAYPFLVRVPGFDVTAEGVGESERQENLAALQLIGAECRRRGIHFQLGLWNHAYEMTEAPRLRYPVRGVTADNHATYSAAGIKALLGECPDIDGLTFRMHYEAGVPEPGHDFWRTVMQGIADSGRRIQLDLHSKGVDAQHIDVAQRTGSSVVISAKYCAEHQSLPYHQTAIREMEEARKDPGTGLRAITQYQRRFTRYGYGDFLAVDRQHDFLFRIWPGTQRLLLWGDPVLAAGYGRHATLGGALGTELCEPLTFKGRKDTGSDGDRDPYVDPDLRTGRDAWKKYRYTYRLWGRLLYDPQADPESWRRWLRHEHGPAAGDVERALGSASRILPLVTNAHGPSASCNFYWPEMYTDMAITEAGSSGIYDFDTPAPGTLGAASPFDPALFYGINEFADDLVTGRRSGRYSPLDVAQWLEQLAEDAESGLESARGLVPDRRSPDFRRLEVDVTIQALLGRFFADKFRSGTSYALYQRTGERAYLEEAVGTLGLARERVLAVVDVATGVYRDNLTFGDRRAEQGHWRDRLPSLERDLDAMERELAAAGTSASAGTEVLGVPRGPRPGLDHEPTTGFTPGQPLPLEATVDGDLDGGVLLRYRHLNQGERWVAVPMDQDGDTYRATIPASYSDSPYHLTYYFELTAGSGDAWLVPGLEGSLADTPYHVVTQRR